MSFIEHSKADGILYVHHSTDIYTVLNRSSVLLCKFVYVCVRRSMYVY